MANTAEIRGEIRALVDPLLLKFRQELFGSGASFGRLTPGALPPSTVIVGGPNGTTDPNDLNFVRGISIYSGGTLIGTEKTELSIIGAGVSVVGSRATIDIVTPLAYKLTNPMTTAGDMIYSTAGGSPSRRSIGSTGQYLSVVAGVPTWVTLGSGTGDGLVDPTTSVGDIIYRNTVGITRRAIGTTGQVLQVSGSEPVWANAPLTGMTNPMTTVGDIIRADTSGIPIRVSAGTEGYRLAISGGVPQWSPLPPPGFASPFISIGDILYAESGGSATRLAIGTSGQVLEVINGKPRWATISVSGLVDPTVALGDIIYHDATGLTRLAIGELGQVLTVDNGNIPVWMTSSGVANDFADDGDILYGRGGHGSATNLALLSLGAVATAWSNYGGSLDVSHLIDGSDSTDWSSSAFKYNGAYIQVDLGQREIITSYRLNQYANTAYTALTWDIQASDDASTWVTVDSHAFTTYDTGIITISSAYAARYWRCVCTTTAGNEWNVWTFELLSNGIASAVRLPIGTVGQVLTVTSGNVPTWITPIVGSGGGGVVTSGFISPMTTAGDIIYATTAGVAQRLPIGTSDQVLTVIAGSPSWRSNTGGGSGGGSVLPSLGAEGQVLMVSSGQAVWGDVPIHYFDTLPTSVHISNDEFSGTTLDTKWVDISSGTGLQWTKTVSNGWLTVEPAQSGIGSTGKYIMGIRQDAPTGAFTVMAKLANMFRPDDVREGIFVAQGTRINVCGLDTANGAGAQVIGCNSYSETGDGAGYDGFYTTIAGLTTGPLFAKIVWDGSILSFFYSLNGVLWSSITTRTGMSQPTRIGIVQYSQNSGQIAANHQLACNWFRVTEP